MVLPADALVPERMPNPALAAFREATAARAITPGCALPPPPPALARPLQGPPDALVERSAAPLAELRAAITLTKSGDGGAGTKRKRRFWSDYAAADDDDAAGGGAPSSSGGAAGGGASADASAEGAGEDPDAAAETRIGSVDTTERAKQFLEAARAEAPARARALARAAVARLLQLSLEFVKRGAMNAHNLTKGVECVAAARAAALDRAATAAGADAAVASGDGGAAGAALAFNAWLRENKLELEDAAAGAFWKQLAEAHGAADAGGGDAPRAVSLITDAEVRRAPTALAPVALIHPAPTRVLSVPRRRRECR